MAWSETTGRRKPMRGATRWYESDADRAPLGELPESILDEIRAHWAIVDFTENELPESFNSLSDRHFSGLPIVGPELKDFFLQYCGSEVQVIPLEKIWSVPSGVQVGAELFAVNIYGSFPSVDYDRTPSQKVQNPNIGAKRSVTTDPNDIYVHELDVGDVHIWRDAASSIWLCDDVFRDAMTEFRPENYRFERIRF